MSTFASLINKVKSFFKSETSKSLPGARPIINNLRELIEEFETRIGAHPIVKERLQREAWRQDIPLIDMHCHPCLKIYLLNKEIWEKHFVLPDVVPSGMHYDLPGMEVGNVKVAFCYHYIPEAGFGHLPKSECLFKFLEDFLAQGIIKKFEADTHDGFEKAMMSIKQLNSEITIAKTKGFDVTIATNFSEFDAGWNQRRTVLVHCLEGGHHIGKDLSVEKYKERLAEFKRQGVCIMTISHFFPNALCDTGGGVPPHLAESIGYSKDIANSIGSSPPGLTQAGHEIVEWCQQNRMIIDLVHSSEKTRTDIYEIVEARKTQGLRTSPVIFSHSGIRENVVETMNSNDKLILPTFSELKRIFDLGGMISIILMNYWTTGVEEDDLLSFDPGIRNIINTIKAIHDEFNSYDNIGIGTDLDGFSQVPDDLKHVRFMEKLRTAIVKAFGEDTAKKICYQNALNMIQQGWQ